MFKVNNRNSMGHSVITFALDVGLGVFPSKFKGMKTKEGRGRGVISMGLFGYKFS